MKKKILFLIFSVLAIIVIMPRGVILEMTVIRGGEWKEQTLQAPFDIPLLKSADEQNSDLELMASTFEPIFTYDTSQIETIQSEMAREVYKRGIIIDDEKEKAKSGSIRIIEGINLTHKPLSEIKTVSEAEEYLRQNDTTYISGQVLPASLKYNEQLNSIDYLNLYQKISNTNGVIEKGEIIVSQGQLIDEQTQLRIDSYVKEYKSRMGTDIWWLTIAAGRFVIISIVMLLNFAFFSIFSNDKSTDGFKEFAFISGSYLLILALLSLIYRINISLAYIIPITIIPILFLVLFNLRTAMIGNITISILAALFTQVPFEYFTVNLLSGMSAVMVLQNFYHRNELFKAVLVVLFVEIITSLSFKLIEGYSIFSYDTLTHILILAISNIILLGFYQLIYVIEKIFGFITNITLFENSDTNQPLLLKLAHTAPGTFQHSIQVANLAESAAKAVGANPLLSRCGALYHDIGKIKDPMYFIENCTGGFNPHDQLSALESVKKIKAHVTDGLEIAKENNLPDCIKRFIQTHHGDSLIQYFYKKALDEDSTTSVADYSYPGINPQSKEECILMICDAIEAASRSLGTYNKDTINDLVERITSYIINNGHLANSYLTFEEVNKIKDILKENLQNIYHVRIAYPK